VLMNLLVEARDFEMRQCSTCAILRPAGARARRRDPTHFNQQHSSAMLDESSGLEFGHGRAQFVLRVHDNRAIPRDRFFNRLT